MNKQSKVIGRLVDIKQRAVEAAEAAFALACQATKSAEQARDRAEAVWVRVASEDATGVGIVADLADRDVQLRALRRAADAAARNIALAKKHETGAREAIVAAKIEHRRYETWLERMTAAHAAEVRRTERVAEDEVTARKTIENART
jgi:lambda repressor-like predicted transcriptional regulator